MKVMNFNEMLETRTREVEAVVERYLPAADGYQKTVLDAMNYSVRAGGKRLRPMLMEETYRLFGGSGTVVEPFMAAIEMIHTSSLIHDDLPCMDNDELRRGLPTTWVKYGYDMAVLAGDSLLIYAVETAAKAFALTEDAAVVGRCIGILAQKTGIYGMIGGQTVDVELTNKPVPHEKLDFIYHLKTGALLESSMMIGALLAGADEEETRLVDNARLADFVTVDERDSVVVMTRGHKDDQAVQAQMLRTPAHYIGVIGSRRKTAGVFARLREEGFTDADLARITTPIGLDIKAETPAEIAVSIAAQLIQVRAERAGH